MKLDGNTLLITGGSAGIGLSLARHFHQAGSQVIICGRSQERLEQATKLLPGISTYCCDLGSEDDRIKLSDWVTKEHPTLNMLINNAGVQRYPKPAEPAAWQPIAEEIAINLQAPIHLSNLLTPHLSRAQNAAIIMVTSGLAFAPLANAPVYSATKAALHSYTLSLRHHLKSIGIQVLEIIPPAVNTDLGGPGLHIFGVNVDEFTASVIEQLLRSNMEATFGTSAFVSKASRSELDDVFNRVNPAS